MQKLAKLGKPWCQCSLGVAYLYEYYRILWWRERRFASWRESSNVLAGSPLLLRRAPVKTAKSLFFPNYHCSVGRYYLGFIYKEELAFNNKWWGSWSCQVLVPESNRLQLFSRAGIGTILLQSIATSDVPIEYCYWYHLWFQYNQLQQ
jgi:hypothetical protein